MTSRLSPDRLPQGTATLPGYDRQTRDVGIVHLGLGAFTRAHQAYYTDCAMERGGGDWMIAGVSMRSPAVGDQLNPQGGLYTLAEQAGEALALRVIGSVRAVLLASERGPVLDLLAAPTTHIVTFTVTEKGYCRKADGTLDFDLAEQGFYPLLASALERRKTAATGGLTLLSCDNLADNGHQLRRLLIAYLAARDADLAEWVTAHCTFPCSMVDRIVPATTDDNRALVEAALGLRDEGVVMTEPFSQWVIEDAFAGPRPAWEQAGAQIVADVAPYETAKLRMLNGAHSALAYLGLQAGHSYVHEAIRDSLLRDTVWRLMVEEAAPTISPAAGQDLRAYAQSLIQRFANPALHHRLIQIAMDGSQKIPQRWLATLAANQRAGRPCPALLSAIAAWLAHTRGDNVARWGPLDDPRALDLAQVWHKPDSIVEMVFGPQGLLASDWLPSDAERQVIASHLPAGHTA